jgi:hypothetical protein
MAASVFRGPRECLADIDEANDRINRINSRIQELSRERTHWANRKDDARRELEAMKDPDGHLPGCSRDERCPSHVFKDGWCRL